MCWDREGRRVPDLGALEDGQQPYIFAGFLHSKQSKGGGTGAGHGSSPEYESNPARLAQAVKPKTLGRRSLCCVHDLRGGIPGSISFEVHPQPPPPGRYTSPPTRHISTWGGTGTSSAASAYCTSTACVVGGGRRWNRWCQSCMAGVAVLRPSYTVRLSRLEAPEVSFEGVLLH